MKKLKKRNRLLQNTLAKESIIKTLNCILIVAAIFSCQPTTAQVAVPPPPPLPPPIDSIPAAILAEEFEFLKEAPMFPGCEDQLTDLAKKECAKEKMWTYIYANLEYPKEAIEKEIEGTVVLCVSINKEGRMDDLRIKKDIGAGCGKEAIRVVESLNKIIIKRGWTPGKARGDLVTYYILLPIMFELD